MLISLFQRPVRLLAAAAAALLLLFCLRYLHDTDLTATGRVTNIGFGGGHTTGTDKSASSPLHGASPSIAPIQPGRAVSRVAKVSVAVNALDIPVIHRAFETHRVHNEVNGYLHYIADKEVVSSLIDDDVLRRGSGAYTKPAYLLAIIIAELLKPEAERLEWLFWFDGDTIITNPSTPLEIFVPPNSSEILNNIHFLIAANWDGLNSGAFAVRVCKWSASFLSAVLAYPMYERERTQTDRFRDQSAIQFLLTDPDSPLARERFRSHNHWAEVPMRWFNSLPINNAFYEGGRWIFADEMTEATFDDGTTQILDDGRGGEVQPWKVMRGDLMVHFAGTRPVRDSWMTPWLDRAEKRLPEWDNSTYSAELAHEAALWWKEYDRTAMPLYMKPIPPPPEANANADGVDTEAKEAKETRETKEAKEAEKTAEENQTQAGETIVSTATHA